MSLQFSSKEEGKIKGIYLTSLVGLINIALVLHNGLLSTTRNLLCMTDKRTWPRNYEPWCDDEEHLIDLIYSGRHWHLVENVL